MIFISLLTAGLLLVAGGIPIQGQVVDENDQPVAGAVVKIATARPRVGPQMTCPSCYTDCGKVVISDNAGKFVINDVSPALFFNLVSGKFGFQGDSASDVDPLEPEFKLHLKRLAKTDADQTLSARVVDLDGLPISGAMVTVGTVIYADGRIRGSDETITPANVTDTDGQFAILVSTPVRAISLKVRVPGFAATDAGNLTVGRPGQEIRIGPGASLLGRIVHNGKPVSGLKLGLVQSDRRMGNVLTPEELVTDKEGAFRWDNLPPEMDYAIYGITAADGATIPVAIATAPKHGELADLGDIAAQRTHTLQVRLVTTDGQPIPDKAYANLSRSRAWYSDKQTIPPEIEPMVEFEGLAGELFEIGIRVPGYKIVSSSPVCQIDLNEKLQIYSNADQCITVMLEKPQS